MTFRLRKNDAKHSLHVGDLTHMPKVNFFQCYLHVEQRKHQKTLSPFLYLFLSVLTPFVRIQALERIEKFFTIDKGNCHRLFVRFGKYKYTIYFILKHLFPRTTLKTGDTQKRFSAKIIKMVIKTKIFSNLKKLLSEICFR